MASSSRKGQKPFFGQGEKQQYLAYAGGNQNE